MTPPEIKEQPHIIAVCGKGGAGKTAFSALLSRALLALDVKPLLLVDADPAGGLVSALGENVPSTLAGVREELIRNARDADEQQRTALAQRLDYMLLQALAERDEYSLLAMGRTTDSRCFCPANTLLRQALDQLSGAFAAVLIDAEAGLEQIQRRVTQKVSLILVVVDGSRRSMDTLDAIVDLADVQRVAVVANRTMDGAEIEMPEHIQLVGTVPEDNELRTFDKGGRSLWELPESNPAMAAAGEIAERLFANSGDTIRN